MDEVVIQGLTLEEAKEFIDLIVSKTKMFSINRTVLVQGSTLSKKDNERLYELIQKYQGKGEN